MKRVIALLRGLIEARNDITTHYDQHFIEWYDIGRNIGQYLTKEDNQ